MKNPSIIYLLLLVLVFISSCGDDADEVTADEIPTDGIYYGETKLNIETSFILDYGNVNSHYNYDFILTDGSVEDVLLGDFENITFGIGMTLYSSGTSFEEGTFEYRDAQNNRGFDYFRSISYVEFLDGEPNELFATGGTVTVSGTSESYTLELDLEMENGKEIRGTFTGSFDVIDPDLFDGDVGPTESINIDFSALEGNSRLLYDYGADATHYNYDFIISDFDGISGTYEIYLELFSEGAEQFQPGIFSFGKNSGNYFTRAYYLDANSSGFAQYDFTGGTVEIQQDGSEYTIIIDAEMELESTIAGSQTGVFILQE
jgi:hypothetical protein